MVHAIPDAVGPGVLLVSLEVSARAIRVAVLETFELLAIVGDAPFLDCGAGLDVSLAMLTIPDGTLDILPVLALSVRFNQPLLPGLAPGVHITASIWIKANEGKGAAILGFGDASHLRDCDGLLRVVNPDFHCRLGWRGIRWLVLESAWLGSSWYRLVWQRVY